MASKKVIKKSTDNIVEQCLHGEDVDSLIASLSQTGRDHFYKILNEIRTGGTSSELEDLWKIDYTRKPPQMDEFIHDDYWLGSVLKQSEDNPGLFPTWKKILCRDFDLDSRMSNLVITGSLGIGKTYVMCVIFLYRLTCATLLRNPQNFFGLSKGSRIVYAILSITRATVAATAFGDAQNFMANSPYFTEALKFNFKKKYSDQDIPLTKDIHLTAGSKGHHVIGQNTLGVALDEGNWRLEKNPDLRAYNLYNDVRTRIKNRFQKTAGFLPAISIIASSAKDESSFTEKVIEEIVKNQSKSTELVYRYAIYDIKSHTLKLSKRWFKVVYGLKNVEPYILSGWYDRTGKPINNESCEQAPIGCKTELVPEDYIEEYKRNCSVALQGLSGISTGSSQRLFSSSVDIENCVELSEQENIFNPTKSDLISISEEDDLEIWDYLDHPQFLTRYMGKIVPKRHSGAYRFIHIDNATRSRCGLSVCHLSRFAQVENVVNKTTGEVYAEERLIVEYDFILGIISGKTKPISFEKVLKFVLWLRDKCGYHIAIVTADQYQSTMQLQMLENRGIATDQLSLDRKKTPYYAWRQAFEEKRIRLYRQEALFREIQTLVDLKDKIDHATELDNKDICDSAAGSYWSAVNFKDIGAALNAEPVPALHQATKDPVSKINEPQVLDVEATHRKIRKIIV